MLNRMLQLLPPSVRSNKAKDAFVYSCSFEPLAASDSDQRTITINEDASFLICGMVRTARDTGTQALVVPAVTINLTDNGTGREIFDNDQDLENVAGTAQLPAIWPYPKMVKRSSSILVDANNLIATAIDLRIALIGFKIFTFDWTASEAAGGAEG